MSRPGIRSGRTSAMAKPAVRVRAAAVNRVVNLFMGAFLGELFEWGQVSRRNLIDP
ncbi:hypothetical protein D3C72_2381910 [compost metagenome]